jgi:hypothetical protein
MILNVRGTDGSNHGSMTFDLRPYVGQELNTALETGQHVKLKIVSVFDDRVVVGALNACRTCGALGDCGGLCDSCANCWEVERRLEQYLCSRKGCEFVAEKLTAALQARFAGLLATADDIKGMKELAKRLGG